jgi:hypothetical protein
VAEIFEAFFARRTRARFIVRVARDATAAESAARTRLLSAFFRLDAVQALLRPTDALVTG